MPCNVDVDLWCFGSAADPCLLLLLLLLEGAAADNVLYASQEALVET